MTNIYIAGSLFSEGEIAQRTKEGKLLSQIEGVKVYNPVEQPFNANKENLPSPQEIFLGDNAAIENCDIFLADISNPFDSGLMVELGLAYAYHKKIIAVNSDIRLPDANKYDIPTVSMNHFVLGAILCGEGRFFSSFEQALNYIKEII